jgi:hypothetical protein
MHDGDIYILTSLLARSGRNAPQFVYYTIDEFFEIKNLVSMSNTENRDIDRVISSSFGNNTLFMGIEYKEYMDSQLGLIKETQLASMLVNKEGFPLSMRLGAQSVLYDRRIPTDGNLNGFNALEAAVLISDEVYFVTSFYEYSGDGFLPGQYYLQQGQFGRVDLEVNLNNLLSEFISSKNSAGLSFNGMYYDDLFEHFVLDITFLPSENSISSERFNVFVSSDGELIGVQEFNWRNGSVLSPRYRNHVYDDGTILSTSERGILIQRVK